LARVLGDILGLHDPTAVYCSRLHQLCEFNSLGAGFGQKIRSN